MAMLIPLTRGAFALVDDDDYKELSQFNWCVSRGFNTNYAVRGIKINGRCVTMRMHRVILGLTDHNIVVDHINHDGLDNRRSNIRACSQSDNMKNAMPSLGKTSRYKGVAFTPHTGRWRSYIRVDGRRMHIGYFASETEAALAYDNAAKKHYGKFAYLNFTEESYVNSPVGSQDFGFCNLGTADSQAKLAE